MRLYLPIHLVGLALQFSGEESDWLVETWDEYSVFVDFRQALVLVICLMGKQGTNTSTPAYRTSTYQTSISGQDTRT